MSEASGELRENLLSVLAEMTDLPDINQLGDRAINGLVDFNYYLQSRLAEFSASLFTAKQIIRTMEIIRIDPRTDAKIRIVIESIFTVMDPRDQNFRYGDCDCASCRFFRDPTPENLAKAIKEQKDLGYD